MNSKIISLLVISLFIQNEVFAVRKSQKPDQEFAIKKYQFMFSTGYGTPSFVRTYLKYKNTHDNYEVTGFGPFVIKAEFMISHKFGLGVNASFSQSQISWLEGGYDTIQQTYRDFENGIKAYEASATIRGNYHFWKRKNFDSYAGLGIGYGKIHMWSFTLAHTTQFSIVYDFPPPLSLECTWGCKYFPIKNLGIFAELGVGKSFLLFDKYFIPEALIQLGLTLKL